MACLVCGDRENGSRYGAAACLGCIVFFRRAVVKGAVYRCLKQGNCHITFESRCICRRCRFDKCLRVGMNPNAIQRRDVMGPRKRRPSPPSPSCPSITPPPAFLHNLGRLQIRQRQSVKTFFSVPNDIDADMFERIASEQHRSGVRRARRHDVNAMIRCALLQACEWAQYTVPGFRELEEVLQRGFLREYALAFMLVEQGQMSAKQPDESLWILQNNTFMCADYDRGLPIAERCQPKNRAKAKLHPLFVEESLCQVASPLRWLCIDESELAALKTLALLAYRSLLPPYMHTVMDQLHAQTTDALWRHCGRNAERFGAILLLTTNIRSTVLVTHSQTRVSDLFGLMHFDPLVKHVFLS